MLICLGIESTAHTLGIGIVTEKGDILANVCYRYKPREGIIPAEAAEDLSNHVKETLEKALETAGITLDDIGLVAFARGPGMAPQLRVGAVTARTLSLLLDIPIVGVNHCIAHLEIARLVTGAQDPVMLYVSGGNTQVIAFQDGRYRVFGETEDIGVGNFLDCVARLLGLGFPGGPIIEKLAKEGRRYIPLPYTVKGMNITLGGMLTSIKNLVEKGGIDIKDLCYSIQETVFAMLIEVSERAMAHCRKNEFVITGGVAANQRLQEMGEIMCKERGAKFYRLPKEYAMDNGAMIAWTGILVYRSRGPDRIEDTGVLQRWRVDEVEVTWR